MIFITAFLTSFTPARPIVFTLPDQERNLVGASSLLLVLDFNLYQLLNVEHFPSQCAELMVYSPSERVTPPPPDRRVSGSSG